MYCTLLMVSKMSDQKSKGLKLDHSYNNTILGHNYFLTL